jgi:hypothetical protein
MPFLGIMGKPIVVTGAGPLVMALTSASYPKCLAFSISVRIQAMVFEYTTGVIIFLSSSVLPAEPQAATPL